MLYMCKWTLEIITKIIFPVFTACRPGFYKAFAGNTKCSKCPPHSLTYMEATSVCQCEKGYFRAEKDPPSMACTSKSTHFAFGNPVFNPFGPFILNCFLKRYTKSCSNSVFCLW